jgi:hypothetical protein
MLGRLRMSVTEAIDHYKTLAQRVFSNASLIGRDRKFRANKLEEVLKEIVENMTGRPDELMLDRRPEGEACKTYAVSHCLSCRKADRPSASCVPCLR